MVKPLANINTSGLLLWFAWYNDIIHFQTEHQAHSQKANAIPLRESNCNNLEFVALTVQFLASMPSLLMWPRCKIIYTVISILHFLHDYVLARGLPISSLFSGMLWKWLRSQNWPAQAQIQPSPPEPDPRRNKGHKGLCPETHWNAKRDTPESQAQAVLSRAKPGQGWWKGLCLFGFLGGGEENKGDKKTIALS